MALGRIAIPFVPPRLVRRHGWTIGVYALLLASLIFTVAIHPTYGAFDIKSLALGALPLALAAAAQTVVVLSGGIDLTVGPLMAVANVLQKLAKSAGANAASS